MNINILINRLQNDEREFDDVWISDADAKVIVALLEAGQAMRDCLGRDGSADDTLDDIYIANDIELAFEVEAWDAATKEDV